MSGTLEHFAPRALAKDQDATQTAQLFAAMVAIEPEAAPCLVRYLAEHDNFPLLRTLLAAEAVAAGHQYAAEVACALAPLLGHGKNEQERAELVSGWLKLLNLDTPAKLGAALPRVHDADNARDLIRMFGADPLAIVPFDTVSDERECTALGHALLAGEAQKTTEILAALIDQGRDPVAIRTDEGPISLFDLIRQKDAQPQAPSLFENASITVLEKLRDMEVPEQWQRQAGQALLNYLEEQKVFDRRKDNPMLPMLGNALFDDPDAWLRVMRSADVEHGIPTSLLGKEKENLALGIISNMERDGACPDGLTASRRIGTSLVVMPWLHAALATDRVEIVEALLDAGSKPGVATHLRHDQGSEKPVAVQRDAIDVAQSGSASEKLVLAWKARQAIGSVLESSGRKLESL